jgi:hypothetical protein
LLDCDDVWIWVHKLPLEREVSDMFSQEQLKQLINKLEAERRGRNGF